MLRSCIVLAVASPIGVSDIGTITMRPALELSGLVLLGSPACGSS